MSNGFTLDGASTGRALAAGRTALAIPSEPNLIKDSMVLPDGAIVAVYGGRVSKLARASVHMLSQAPPPLQVAPADWRPGSAGGGV